MDKDFSQYIKIINEFRGQVLKSDFETKFVQSTKHIPKTDRFLLKMELKRLAAPCTRLVDLRGHVDGECRPYEHENRVHYLDDIAIRVFEENLAYYGGYTFGVYEAVTNTENNFRVIYQREKANVSTPVLPEAAKVFEKLQYPAQCYQFGHYFNRSEERMNFAVQVKVFIENKEIDGTSSDISVEGCKFRLNEMENFQVGQSLEISFTGFEQEFQFGGDNRFEYEVKNIQIIDNIQFVGVKRLYDESKKRDGFKRFLQGFIQGNKRRYKINLDNTISALQARSLEQYVLPKSNELPLFIDDTQGAMLPRFALTCNNNQATFQYWQDEKRDSTLYCLITQERIARIKKAAALGRTLLVYSFIHKSNDKYYFYTADEKQLAQDEGFMKQFLGFAASKSTFAITELSLLHVEPEAAYSPLTLSNTLSKKNEYLNAPPSEDVMATITNLPYIVVASDITDDRLRQDYSKLDYQNINTAKLKNFGHKRLSKPIIVDEVGINYRNQRQEARFIYKTPAVVEVQGVRWTGVSHDFSMSGLKIELEKSAVLNKEDIVYLSFPKLQKVTSAFDLKRLPYEIMRINKKKTIINLRVYVEQHQHIGRAFFKLLIEKNRSKLTPDEYALMTPGQAKALRNLYSYSVNIPSVIVQTSGSRYKMEALATSCVENGKLLPVMRDLSDRQHYFNLYPILNNQQALSVMSASLKQMQDYDAPVTDILYIAVDPNEDMVDKAVTTKLSSELDSPKLKQIFIRNALKKGYFFCIQMKLSRTDEPDMDHLNPELSYISSYAIHRGKQIEQDIWSVVGVIQLFDITNEALIRNKIIPTA